MRLFGKKELPEAEAAGLFVLAINKSVQGHWPDVVNDLKVVFCAEESMSSNRYASYEFLLAVVACQIQALPNVLPADQARRVREHVMQCVSNPELGAYPREAIQEYQDAWDLSLSLEESENPLCSVASVLFDKIECQSTVKVADVYFKDPVLLLALSEKLLTCGLGWWKSITKEYRLVP